MTTIPVWVQIAMWLAMFLWGAFVFFASERARTRAMASVVYSSDLEEVKKHLEECVTERDRLERIQALHAERIQALMAQLIASNETIILLQRRREA